MMITNYLTVAETILKISMYRIDTIYSSSGLFLYSESKLTWESKRRGIRRIRGRNRENVEINK